MREIAQEFVGRHDFAGFCNKDSNARTTVRRVFEVELDERGPLIDFWISGEGFLKQMVRIIVGTLVEIAGGIPVLSEKGKHSGYVDFTSIQAADPEIIVIAPCGFAMDRTLQEINLLLL